MAEEQSQTQGRAVPAPLAHKGRTVGADGEKKAGGGTRSYSRRAASPAPSVPHPRGKARPLGQVHAEGLRQVKAARSLMVPVRRDACVRSCDAYCPFGAWAWGGGA